MRFIPAVLMALFALPVAAEPRIHCTGQEQNLETYLQMYQVLFMDRDGDRVHEFYQEQIINHNNDTGGGETSVIDTSFMGEFWKKSKEMVPDRTLEDELILCVDDYVIVRTLLKSRFVEPIEGIGPTGEPYEYTATDIYRFEDGKVAERWGNNDFAYVYRQLGFTISKD